jgi:hypothetical protein
MILHDMKVERCNAADIADFVRQHHYSHVVPMITTPYCFRVVYPMSLVGRLAGYEENIVVGAAIFGRPGMKDQITKYSERGKYTLTELRRFVMIDETPRNSETYVLGRMFQTLAKLGIERVLSYADPSHGHTGVIYRATGFQFVGETPRMTFFKWKGRKLSHRSLNRCHNNTRKLGQAALNLRAAIKSGEAQVTNDAGKFIYIKNLRTLGGAA